jgi:hypothetical protein
VRKAHYRLVRPTRPVTAHLRCGRRPPSLPHRAHRRYCSPSIHRFRHLCMRTAACALTFLLNGSAPHSMPCLLIFVTPDRQTALDLGYGEDTLRRLPLRILRARDQLLGRAPQWDTIKYMRRAEEEAQEEPPAYLVPIIIGVRFVFGPLVTIIGIILILDLIIGDWLIDQVPFWDRLIGLLDWLPI